MLQKIFDKILLNYRKINNNKVLNIPSCCKETKKLIKEFLVLYNKEKGTNYLPEDFSIKSFIQKFIKEY